MAHTIKLKRTSTAGNKPDNTNITTGELALNTADKSLYIQTGTANTDIVTLYDDGILHLDDTNNRVGIGTTSPTHHVHITGGITNGAIGFDSSSLKLGTYSGIGYNRIYGTGTNLGLSVNNGVIKFENQGSEFARLTNTGRLGLGETSPNYTIHAKKTMASTPSNIIYLEMSGTNADGGGGAIRFDTSATNSTETAFYASVEGVRSNSSDGSNELRFFTAKASISSGAPTQRMVIDEDGNVGIGTASPTEKLHIVGGDLGIGVTQYRENNIVSYASADYALATSGAYNLIFKTNNTERIRINSNGQLGIGVTNFTNAQRSNGKQLIIGDCFVGTSASLVVDEFSRFGGPIYFHQDSSTNAANSTAIDNNGNRLVITGKNGTTANALDAPDGFYVGGTQFINSSRNLVNIGTITSGNITANISSGGQGYILQSNSTEIGKFARTTVGSTVVPSLDGATGRDIHIGGVVNTDVILANAGGNVGIHTISPVAPLDVRNTTGSISSTAVMTAQFRRDDGTKYPRIQILSDTDGSIINHTYSTGAGKFRFQVAQNDIMTLQDGGNVGIGTTSPAQKLHVVGGGQFTNSVTVGDSTSDALITTGVLKVGLSGGTTVIDSSRNLVNIGTITASGNIVINSNSALLAARKIAARDTNGLAIATSEGTERIGVLNSGAVRFNNAFILPTAIGSAGQVLKVPTSGTTLYWADEASSATQTSIADADGDTKIQVEESADEDKIRFDTAGSQRVIIDDTGRVGISTDSPNYLLDIESASSALLRIYNTGSNVLTSLIAQNDLGTAKFSTQSGYSRIHSGSTLTYAASSTDSIFYSSGTEKMRVIGTGLTIGTATDTTTLEFPDKTGIPDSPTETNDKVQLIKMGQGGNGGMWQTTGRGGMLISSADDSLILANGDVGRFYDPNAGGHHPTAAGETLALLSDFDIRFTTGLQDGWSGGSTYSPKTSVITAEGRFGIGTTSPGEKLEVIGNVEAEEFIGDIRGATLFKASAGEALSKGDVVYISGISGNTTVVSKADADDANKMPAFGIAAAAASANTPVDVYTSGILSGIDTSSFSEGDELFVSTTAGVLTATPPTGESAALQKIGKVTRSASSGSIFIIGAGRSNATPNLNEGKLFVGNSSNQAVADNTVHVDIANSRVGIGTTSPTDELTVDGSIKASTAIGINHDPEGYLSSLSARLAVGGNVVINDNSPILYLRSNSSGNASDIRYQTALRFTDGAGSESVRITNAGNLGINSTSPEAKLHNIGHSRLDGAILQKSNLSIGSGNISTGNEYISHNGPILTNGSTGNINQYGYFRGYQAVYGTDGTNGYNPYAQGAYSNPVFEFVSNNRGSISLPTDSAIRDGYLYQFVLGNSGSGGSNGGVELTNSNTTLLWGITSSNHAYFANRVGIGASSPANSLEIATSDPIIRLRDTDTGARTTLSAASGVGGFIINADAGNTVANSYIDFKVDNTTRMYINASGNVGIGTSTPARRLHVSTNNVGIATTYGVSIVEATDSQVDLISDSSGTWGSGINLVEGAGTSNTDVWSIVRQTTGGTGDSSLRFNFGTGNNHQNTNTVSFASNGNITSAGVLTSNQSQQGFKHIAPDVMSGHTSRNEMTFSWTADETRWYMFPTVDGSGNFGRELSFDYSSEEWSIEGPVTLSSLSTGNITTTGYLRGPSTFTIDPSAHGDNTGTVVIAGNLQVDGTTTTINSTTLTVDDKNITLASGSTNAAAANGAGITVDCGSDTDATLTYLSSADQWKFNKELLVQDSNFPQLKIADADDTMEIGYAGENFFFKRSDNDGAIIFRRTDNSDVMSVAMSTKRVGIGSSSPTYGFQVSNSNTSQSATGTMYVNAKLNSSGKGLVIDSNTRTTNDNAVAALETITRANTTGLKVQVDGNVGIGTSSPSQKLQVAGTILADTALAASSGNTAIGIGSESNITDGNSTYKAKLITDNNNAKLTTYQYGSYLTLKAGVDGTGYSNNWSKIELRDGGGTGSNNAHMKFYTHGDERMVIDNYGNVGIGTNNPVDNYAAGITPESTKLAVVGANVSGYTEVAHFAAGTDSDNTGATVRIGHVGNDRGMFIKAGRGTSNQAKALLGVRNASNADSNILTLQEGGRVGIGTTSPNYTLDVVSTGGGINIGGTGAYLRWNSGDLQIKNEGSYKMGFYTYNSSDASLNRRMVIDTNGYVGIGTDSPAIELDIKRHTNAYPLRIGSSQGEGRAIAFADVNASPTKYNWIAGTQYNINNGFEITPSTAVGGYTFSNPALAILQTGNVGINQTSPAAKLQVEELGIDTTTTSTTATTQVAIDTFAAATFRSARYTIQVTNSTDSTYHLTEILLIHNGTTPQITEYGTIFTGSAEATFDADISSGNVRLLATPASTDSMTFKVVRHCITV